MTESYLQRLGGTDTDWDRSCFITRRRVSAVLQPYYQVLQERGHEQGQQLSALILKGTLKSP
jgi:hypothetical protein